MNSGIKPSTYPSRTNETTLRRWYAQIRDEPREATPPTSTFAASNCRQSTEEAMPANNAGITTPSRQATVNEDHRDAEPDKKPDDDSATPAMHDRKSAA
jgi:hypothetical protein